MPECVVNINLLVLLKLDDRYSKLCEGLNPNQRRKRLKHSHKRYVQIGSIVCGADDKIAGASFNGQHSEGAGRHQTICGTRGTEALGQDVCCFCSFP